MNAGPVQNFLIALLDLDGGQGPNGTEESFGDGLLIVFRNLETQVDELGGEDRLVVFGVRAIDHARAPVVPAEFVPVDGDEKGIVFMTMPLETAENWPLPVGQTWHEGAP